MAEPPEAEAAPAASFSLVQMLPTLLFDVAIPIIVFNLLTRFGVSTLWAVILGGLSPGLNNLRTWFPSGRLEPLGIIVIMFLAIGAVASLISGSVFFALIKESFLTAAFGCLCLGSLLAWRPLMFHIFRQFVAGDDPVRIDWWNGLWQYDNFRTGMRFVTTVWGIAYLIEAVLRVGFALVLQPALVVTLSPVMAFGLMFVLIAWSRRYLVGLREQRLRAQQQAASG